MAEVTAKNTELGIQGFKDSKNYEQVRPEYPREAIELLMKKLGLLDESRDKNVQLTVLELGAGTGKFTRVMANVLDGQNVRIIASDPVKEMCEQFKEVLPDVEMHQFGAENIGLPDSVADAVVCATSFHWFANKPNAMEEIYRVLKPTGMLGITTFFADGKSQSFVHEVFEYIKPYYGKQFFSLLFEDGMYDLFPSSMFGQLEKDVFVTSTSCTQEQFCQLMFSLSVVQTMNELDRCKFKEFLNKTMEEYVNKTGKEIDMLAYKATIYYSKKLE